MPHAKEIQFEGWTLKVDSGDLVRDGHRVRLRKQSQQVLEALLERPGEVVTREQLIARLWPRGVVDFETGLNSAIGRLRRALDDDAQAPRYIETLPRRGYRFIGHATVANEMENVAPTALADRAGLKNAPARRPRLTLMAIGAAIAIALAGSTIVATKHLPASSPAGAAARRSAASSSRNDTASSPNAAATERYRLGRYFLGRRKAGDLERAQEHFEAAIALDPDFAEAYAGLASADWLLAVEGLAPENVILPQLRAAANRALALDPDLAEAHMRLALDALKNGHPDLYEAHAANAWRAEPDNPLLLSNASSKALSEGRFDEGVELARRAAAIEPLALSYRYNLASALFVAGRYEEAKQVNLELLELDPSAWADIAGQVLVLEGRFEQALALVKDWPDDIAKFEIQALAYHGLHERAKADTALAALIRAARERDPLRIVEVYAYRGDTDAAFGWLAGSAEWFHGGSHLPPSPGLMPWGFSTSPFVASLRGSSKWAEVVGKLRDI
jgi:DNA-binding winged helix-turn-helix (wHTH) protein/Tfp pilus assembly protein PilF